MGAFTNLSNTTPGNTNEQRVAFAPSKEFVKQTGLKYEAKYPTNVDSIENLVAMVDSSKVLRVNYSAVAKAAEIPE